jgi:PKD repeat protein
VYYKALPAHNNNKKPKQICWYFGDGRDTCITYPENYSGDYLVRHEYRESGNYEVCIKVQYYGGCEAKNCKIIQVGRPIECKADFERIPLTSVNHPLQVAFRALPWHSNNKKPKQICWYFGDGRDTCIEYPENYAGSYSVAHNYRQPGKYEVCIKIFYYGGCEAKNCEVVYLEGPGECLVKVAELTPSITSLTRGIVIKPWSSLNKKPLAICVKFGDGSDTCIQSSATNPLPEELIIRHTYPAPGLYRTCVKVLFDGGCYAYECIEVVIRGGNNTCGGYMTDSLVSPKTVRFRGFAVNNQNDPVVEYRWNFGDGSGAAGKEVTHSYHAPGTYEVCLQIITQRSCITKICKKLIVPGDIRPVLQLSPNPVSATLHISFYSAYSETINIKIVNSNGVVLKSYAKSITVGNNSWDLDVAVLMPGTYTLYIQSANQLASQLFIKN